ncbi:MAG: hypothetical protein ACM3XO_26570 [Bacteroidota bacterium]
MTQTLEEKIKEFVRSQGVEVVGVAGPDRLDGPPSLDPTYTLKGARSIISMAIPMNADAVHDYMGKKTPVPHNVDQLKENQRMFKISEMVAGYIRSLGYKAAVVPPNGSYRRHPYIFATLPSFSHRFGAMAAGIAGQGWSGNVMTEEYGAATYLGTVVTSAVLKSDPLRYSSRHFVDDWCRKCRVCDKVCVLGMFIGEEEEYILLNGELHPRAKRRNINLCNGSCFGLHAVSNDKKWTTWAYNWTKAWMDVPLEKLTALKVIPELTIRAMMAGDSGPRYKMIRAFAGYLQKDEVLNEYLGKHPETLSHEEHVTAYKKLAEGFGVEGIQDDTNLTCGNCGLVCGPSVEESIKRYRLLTQSGLVVRTADGSMKRVNTFEEAAKIRSLPKRTTWQRITGALSLLWVFHKWYFGFEPKSYIQGVKYSRRLKQAVKDRIKGHKAYVPVAAPVPVSSPATD